jgi:integrase
MTGLRVGELLALKWQDIDFEKFEISVTRSISLQHVGECKTEASRKPVPLDSRLAEALWRWRNPLCLSATGGLGLCQSTRQRNTAVLAGNAQPLALATGSEGRRNPGPDRLAHLPAHIRDSSQSEWGGCQDCAGIIAARK